MAMNLMEVIRMYELDEGTIGVCGGMAMCASCQCYILSNHNSPSMQDDGNVIKVFNTKENSRLSCKFL